MPKHKTELDLLQEYLIDRVTENDKDHLVFLFQNIFLAEIIEDLIEANRSNVSLPFESRSYKRIAVKVVDDRGIESLKVMKVE